MTQPWRDPQLTGAGRIRMHSVAHLDRLDLDGTWRFQFLSSPEQRPTDRWTSVKVPGAWTMQGTDDAPHYTNVQMPFPDLPPYVPEMNPTGVHERTFQLPDRWSGKRVVLHVGAAESVLMVQVNGEDAGIGKDSHLASEFDITRFVSPGENTLRLTVVKWSDASFVEDQDQWWHGGITRSVYLYATEAIHIADLRANAGLADDVRTGTLDLAVTVELGRAPVAGWTVEARLEGHGAAVDASVPVSATLPDRPAPWTRAERDLSWRKGAGVPPGIATADEQAAWETLHARLVPKLDGLATWRVRIPDVRPWSAEVPDLYDLTARLRSPEGRLVEEASIRVGFRRVEIDGLDLLVNGRRVLFHGVNRHDFDRRTGRTVSEADMRADIVQMKRFGFDSVRTSHYPNDPAFLALTDQLGLYVIAEADIESHAFWGTLCDDPRYLAQWVDRVARMAQRDKDHPSVILWSLGNESGYGANHDAAAAWLRRYDPSRPLHYEGAIRFDWAADQAVTDLACPMYPHIDAIVAHARSGRQRHPLIMCEYSHAMGNSNGTLAEYWDAIESTAGLQGGFIWEWWDHGLEQVKPDGSIRWAYGGDFGDVPNDADFCVDGLNWPDRTPKPAMWEHHAIASPVRLAPDGAGGIADGTLMLENRQHFRDAGWLRARWTLALDGAVVRAGDLPLPEIEPGGRGALRLPEGLLDGIGATGEVWLTLSFVTVASTPWCEAGHEVGWAQVPVRGPSEVEAQAASGDAAGVDIDADGRITHPLLAAAPTLALWRAPTQNDRIGGMAASWERLGLDDMARRLLGVERTAQGTIVQSQHRTMSGAVVDHQQVITTLADGSLRIEETAVVPEDLDDLPRVGTVLEAAPGLDRVRWFGAGPHETYPDRRKARIGRWQSSLAEQVVPYIRPQENGGHADVRWLELTDATGHGLRITMDRPRQVSVSPFRASDLAAATHHDELVPHEDAVIHLDAAHRGLGTASCGPDTLPGYLLHPGTYRWSWTFAEIGPAGGSGGR